MRLSYSFVIAGLDPAIHFDVGKILRMEEWTLGSSPRVTGGVWGEGNERRKEGVHPFFG
jgi:hypothetical protein